MALFMSDNTNPQTQVESPLLPFYSKHSLPQPVPKESVCQPRHAGIYQ